MSWKIKWTNMDANMKSLKRGLYWIIGLSLNDL